MALARILQRRTALRVMTETLARKATVVRQEYVPDLIQLRAQRVISVTTLAHATPRPACVRIHRKRMAPHVTTVTPVLKPTLVSPACVPDQTQLHAPPVISVTMLERVIRKLAYVQIRQKRMEPRVTTETLARPTMFVPAASAAEHQRPAPRAINVITRVPAIRPRAFARIHRSRMAPRVTTAISARRTTFARMESAKELRLRPVMVKSPRKVTG